jgi:hypothetical protein
LPSVRVRNPVRCNKPVAAPAGDVNHGFASAAFAARSVPARTILSSGRVGDAMGHGRATFKETDLTRALRAVRKAGADVERVEVDRDGRIVLVLKNGDKVLAERNEWD